MGWFYPKKKSEAWKQGYTLAEQSMDTASLSPTLHLLVILGIVLSLLWLTYYTTYKAQQNQTVIYFQLFLLSPIMFILLLLSYSTCGRLNFCLNRSGHKSLQRAVVSPLKLECTHHAVAIAAAITFLLIFILF